ncbi:MAG: ankyrin repeat domain-containing protein [Gemmataceae bacterium]
MKAPDEYVAMYDAHKRGDVDAVRKLLETHPELEEMGPDDDTVTWLHVAAEMGHIAVAEFWLGRGYDVNLNLRGFSLDKDGLNTPLHLAKDAAMTRYLLSRGASVNACERVVGTPLHNAIIQAVEPSQKGRRRPDGANMDQIRALLEAGADLSLMNGEDKGYTPLAWAIELRRKTAEQLLREVGAPEKGRSPFGRRRKIKKLDLRKDFNEIYEHVVERVRTFDASKNAGPGKGSSPVHMIDIGFQCEQDGWVVLIFDTRPDAQPDGEWNSFIDKNRFERPHWHQALLALEDGSVEVLLPDGKKCKITGETEFEDFVALFGDLLKGVLLKARADGVFKSLPKAEECHMGVEEQEGHYGWPAYEDRGKDDLA